MDQEIQKYLTRLGNAFRSAYKGEMTLKRLYTWGEAIGSKAGDRVLKGKINSDDPKYNLLVWATGITHQLHDVETTDYFRKHPEELEDCAQMLLGEKDAVFSFGWDPIDLNIPIKRYKIKAQSR